MLEKNLNLWVCYFNAFLLGMPIEISYEWGSKVGGRAWGEGGGARRFGDILNNKREGRI